VIFRLYHFGHLDADPEETSMSLSGSPPPTSHATLSCDKVKDATSSVHVVSTASAAPVSGTTVQSPSAASGLV